MTDQLLERVADEILRQVVCSCGGYRHHGVGWMPEGSGEGKSVAIALLKSLVETVKDEVAMAHRAPDAMSKPGAANLLCEVCGKPASWIIERKALCQECREKQQ